MSRWLTDEEAARYGFRWGNWDVTRGAAWPNGGRTLMIESDHVRCQVALSPNGKAITVYPIKGRVQMTRSAR